MSNTITDLNRIPVDKDGYMLYDRDEIRSILITYEKAFPNHTAIAIPENIRVWENLQLDELKLLRNYLDKIIKQKEE